MAGHPEIDRWSWLMHQQIADRIEAGDSRPLAIARANLSRWLKMHGELHPAQLEWARMLDVWSPERMIRMLRAEHDQEAIRLRSNSPFAGVLDTPARLALLREARAA